GNTDGSEGPEAVIERLKASRSEEERRRCVGVASGPLIDTQLYAVMLPADQTRKKGLRAVWDQNAFQFKLSAEEVPGVKEFVMRRDRPEVEVAGGKDQNTGMFSYASESTWIWDYVEAPVQQRPAPENYTAGDPPSPGSTYLVLPAKSDPPAEPVAPEVVAVSDPGPGGESGGIALNLGSGSASASDGIALNVLSSDTTAGEGELAVGVLGLGLSLGGKKPHLSLGKPASLNPGALTGSAVGTMGGSGSGRSSAVNGLAANLGSGDSTAVNGISANAGEGSSTANQGISGNLGTGSSSATNGIGLNLGTGSATAGSESNK
ncbi:MAG: hypothetical protein ABL994_25505, partial [Verrucomicrobiales bacterium]